MSDAPGPTRSNPWKWIIPLGCLTVVLVCGGCLVTPFLMVRSMATSAGFYDEAIREMNDSQELTQLLGEPIEPGWMIQGNVQINNDAGNADITIPVSGPNGSGTASVTATRAAGVWTIDELYVDVDGRGRVNVIPETAPVAPQPTP